MPFLSLIEHWGENVITYLLVFNYKYITYVSVSTCNGATSNIMVVCLHPGQGMSCKTALASCSHSHGSVSKLYLIWYQPKCCDADIKCLSWESNQSQHKHSAIPTLRIAVMPSLHCWLAFSPVYYLHSTTRCGQQWWAYIKSNLQWQCRAQF